MIQQYIATNNFMPTDQVPVFATKNAIRYIDPQLQEEFCKWVVILAREKVFFVLHWALFIIVESVGFYMASHCAFNIIGDHSTRILFSIVPMFYINLVGLVCLVPINGTKSQIAKAQERVNFLKFQIDNHYLIS